MLFRRKSKAAAASGPLVSVVAPDGEADMAGLGHALWRKKTTILGVTLFAAGAAFIVVNAITPRYNSESRLLLEGRENVFLRAEADKNSGERAALDPEAVTSQVQLVLSRDLARKVIEQQKLTSNPEFNGGSGGVLNALLSAIGVGRDRSTMTEEERTLDAYYDRLSVQAIEKSRVISISFSSARPS